MKGKAKQDGLDDLSAWLDGELEGERVERLRRAIDEDAELTEARRELCRLDDLLNRLSAPPPREGLAETIIASARQAKRRGPVVRTLRWLGPVAAAAAVIIGIALHRGLRPSPVKPTGGQPSAQKSPKKHDADGSIAKASFFADFNLLENYDTLEAIEQLESEGQGM